MQHHQETIQITKEVRDDCIIYYLPCRNPKKVLVVTDYTHSLDNLIIEEVPTSKIKPPQATFMQMNTKLTLEKLLPTTK